MWDWIITIIVLVGFILAVWSKVTGKSIKEILGEIRDFIRETKEQQEEYTDDIISYGYYQ